MGLINGIVAGAAGTAALNLATYVDMAIQGRSGSSVPAEVASEAASRAGIELADERETAGNRAEALAQLLGYGTGLAFGGLYGAVADRRELPTPLAGVALGLGVMAATDLSAVALGKTDPRTWGLTGWASDVVPHLLYGLVTVGAYGLRRNGRG